MKSKRLKGGQIKKQNEPKKTKHHKIYNDSKPTYIRHKEVIESIPKRCWWVREYLKATYRFPSQK